MKDLRKDPMKYNPGLDDGEEASKMLRGGVKNTGKMSDTNSVEPYRPPSANPKAGGVGSTAHKGK